MTNKLKAAGEYITRLIYPEVCPLCGIVLGDQGELVCKECSIKLQPIGSPVCLKCGKEVSDQETDCCEDCSALTRSYIKGFPALNYNSEMAKCLSDFKYHNMRCHGRFLADVIFRERGKEILLASPEVIVPVPVHKSKLRDRGYNQAEVLAQELGKRMRLPVDRELIIRGTKTAPQKELSNKQREENLKKAFISSQKIVEYKSALVVDDIYTTGATVEACTSVLHSMGIKDVYYTSVCVGKGY